ncbi:hypothetical protein [Streptomyces sp. NBC_01205]|uniref:hypothetical protein n=1 Tax=Streptomyces sp. NBC_01205 TaxID=2903771 RepID=UPI002E0E9293|nr:hypothetical protein OG573_35090 [Streptomyces sp. NBC_01205]
MAFKGEAPKGHQRPVVTAPVARAVAVLERLQPPGQDFLFAPLPSAARHQVAEQTDRVAGYYTTNKHLAAYVTWTNDYCTTRGRHDLVPDVGGRRFRLTTRQSAAGSPGTAASPFTRSKATRAPATPDSDEVEAEQALARRHFLAGPGHRRGPDRPDRAGSGADAVRPAGHRVGRPERLAKRPPEDWHAMRWTRSPATAGGGVADESACTLRPRTPRRPRPQ